MCWLPVDFHREKQCKFCLNSHGMGWMTIPQNIPCNLTMAHMEEFNQQKWGIEAEAPGSLTNGLGIGMGISATNSRGFHHVIHQDTV